MKRSQKLILILFAFVDLAVIGGLALIVIRSTRPSPPVAAPVASPPSACALSLLEMLSVDGSSARVDWNEVAGSAARATVEVVFTADSLPAPPTPQLLWTVLDRLSPAMAEQCDLPPTLTLRVSVADGSRTHTYAVEMAGEILTGWLRGELDDTELAAHTLYRESALLLP